MKRWLAARRARRHERRLVYSYYRCPCGALYAYDPVKRQGAWDCSDIILDLAVPKGQPGWTTHGDTMPFVFWKVPQAPDQWALRNRVS